MGRIYEEDNKTHMKDSGFTIFYMGINLGGFLGPLFCGYFSKSFGWGYGFGVAAFGVLFGILIFFSGKKDFRIVFSSRVKNFIPTKETDSLL